MIEIKQFDGKSITPKDDALMYDLLFNGYGIFNGCSVSFLGANQLLVSSGRLIVRGRQVVITEETIAAQLSSDGTKKGRLYIHIDLSSASNPIEFRTIVADELPALTQEDDVNYNDGIFELELCNYDVSETAISNIVETCPSITGGVDLLKNMEEVMANTTPGKAADALVVKELSDSLGGLRFGTDGEGNYGYFGADDSLIPFKSGVEVMATKLGGTVSSTGFWITNRIIYKVGKYKKVSFSGVGGTVNLAMTNNADDTKLTGGDFISVSSDTLYDISGYEYIVVELYMSNYGTTTIYPYCYFSSMNLE